MDDIISQILFCRVMKAEAKGIIPGQVTTIVAVKMLKGNHAHEYFTRRNRARARGRAR